VSSDSEIEEHPHGSAPAPAFDGFDSTSVDLGSLTVRRLLPQRPRRTVGPWCFADHFGPTPPSLRRPMQIGPHPHIGLQTVTWLLQGEALHRDSLGSEQRIAPGQLNLMSAGRGVAHAEETPDQASPVMHGMQLWVAQPEATRRGEPAFEHHPELPQVKLGSVVATVLTGTLADATSPARTDSPIVGAQLDGHGGQVATLPLDPSFEHAVVALEGSAAVSGQVVAPGQIVYLGGGRDHLSLAFDGEGRLLLLGGAPFTDELHMWWNFVAADRAEIEAARADWQAQSARFGAVSSKLDRIPAPALPWTTASG
jgi:redox-sensitive bicupin YhaK (pirin superfamily)